MKKILLTAMILLFAINVSAQNNGAKADLEYLNNLMVPDLKVKQEAFQKFRDSVEAALTTNPEFLALQEKAKQINSSDVAQADAGYQAELKINEMKDASSKTVMAEYMKEFNGLNQVSQTIFEVLGQTQYDFVALFEGGQAIDYMFRDQPTQMDYGQRIYKCAVAKGRETGRLDLMSKGSLSKTEMEIADALMADCKVDLLVPMISENGDITSLVEEAMKN